MYVRTAVLAVATVSTLGAIAIVAGVANDSSRGRSVTNVEDSTATEGLDELVASSDIVAEARVGEISTGRSVGPDDDTITFREIRLDITRQYRGERVSQILLEEEGIDANGEEYQLNDLRWLEDGDEGIFFLAEKTDAPGNYRLVNTQGRILFAGSASEFAEPEGPVAQEMGISSGDNVDLVRKSVAASVLDVAENNVPPVTPPPVEDHRLVTAPTTLDSGTEGGATWVLIGAESNDGYCYGLGFEPVEPTQCFSREFIADFVADGGHLVPHQHPRVILGVVPRNASSVIIPGVPLSEQPDLSKRIGDVPARLFVIRASVLPDDASSLAVDVFGPSGLIARLAL